MSNNFKTGIDLSNRVAIVTGAGHGIGRAVAKALAQHGALVVVNDVNQDSIEIVVNEIQSQDLKAVAHEADVSDWKSVKQMVDRTISELGDVNILVNNAGVLKSTSPLESISEKEWDQVIDVNLKGAFNCIKAVIPIMKEQRWGKIVNVSSIAGKSVSNSGGAHYTASKAALLGLTRHAALESAPFGININAIAPAGVDTEMVAKVWPQDRIDDLVKRIPIGRLAYPEEIADLVMFLVSDGSDYISGATIDINGGLLMI